jgi:hypothetical protein
VIVLPTCSSIVALRETRLAKSASFPLDPRYEDAKMNIAAAAVTPALAMPTIEAPSPIASAINARWQVLSGLIDIAAKVSFYFTNSDSKYRFRTRFGFRS